MKAECSNCGCQTFEDMEHSYYGMEWRFSCSECGKTLVVKEASKQNPPQEI